MTWLLKLKSQLALIVGAIIGLLILYIGVLKRAALRKELKQQKAVSNYKDRANEALIKGVENESKDNTLDYFDDKPK